MISWPTELMDVDELASRTAAFNPRTISKAARTRLKASMDEFGMVDTITFNATTRTVLGGHQRLALLQEAGVQKVAVTVVNVPAEKEAALCVVLNREDAMGSWDHTRLDALLGELASGSADLLESLRLEEMPEYKGFNTDQLLQKILSETEHVPQEHDPDPAVVAERLAERVRRIPPGKLRSALLVAVPLSGRGELLILADPDHGDLVSEIRRAHEVFTLEGENSPGPLERLFDAIV